MGDLRFKIPQASGYDRRVWDSAYITGIEGIPWQTRHQTGVDEFSVTREIDESGKLNILWPTSTVGSICLSTTSLRLSDEPYALTVEIARGVVNSLRTQTSDWQRLGLRLPESFFPLAEETLTTFLKALVSSGDPDKQQALAQSAVDSAMRAAVELCNCYSAQALQSRKQSEGRLATLLGVQLPANSSPNILPTIAQTFNLVSLPTSLGAVETSSGKSDFSAFDAHIDWATRHNQKVCIGPLVDFGKGQLPKWMVLLDEGFESVLTAACQHAQACVERYRGKAHLWNCAAGLNVRGDMGWNDEQTLRMAVSLIETVRRTDQRTPVLLTIDQPWSESLRSDDDGISPLHFADALTRADLGLSGICLDLRFGAGDNDSFARDPIEISRLIDRWAMRGLPLMVQLNCPTTPIASDSPSNLQTPQPCSGQIAPETITQLLLSKPSVHAIIWSQLVDDPQSPTANGLWTTAGQPKPILKNLAATRKAFLH